MQWPDVFAKLKLCGGGTGTYRGVHPVTGKRVVNYQDTNWLLDEDGFARADHQPSPQDWTGEKL
jgi:hypothetical protein